MLGVSVVCLALLLGGCGLSGAISGGSPTTIQKHPYQVAIDIVLPLVDDDGSVVGENITMVCSGALITNRTVVTAAVCTGNFKGLLNVTTVQVRVGSQHRESGGEAFKVADYVVHSHYREWLHEHNVLLLYLEEAVPARPEVRPIPLAKVSGAPKAGEKLLVTGYGDLTRDAAWEDGGAPQLRVAAMPFLNYDMCKWWYGFSFGNTNGCIGTGRASVCGQADVGSPVVNWRGELVGVAVNDVNYCSVPGRPAVFTNLALAELNEWVIANRDEKQPLPPTTPAPTPPTGCYSDDCDDYYECDPETEDCSTGSGDPDGSTPPIDRTPEPERFVPVELTH